jgi:hypothetical protein
MKKYLVIAMYFCSMTPMAFCQNNWNALFGDPTMGAAGMETACDKKGNTYYLGNFQRHLKIEKGGFKIETRSVNDSRDFYLIKKDSTNRILWFKQWGGNSADNATGIVVDAKGAIIITANCYGNIDIDPGTGVQECILPDGKSCAVVIKLNDDGIFVWGKQLNSESINTRGITTDSKGSIFITGSFKGTLDADPGPGEFNLTHLQYSNVLFVIKLNAKGELDWAKRFGSTGEQCGLSACTDSKGALIICGNFSGEMDMGVANNKNKATYIATKGMGEYDGFVAKLDGAGNTVWAKQFGSKAYDNKYQENLHGVVVDKNDNIYTTGAFINTMQFTKGKTIIEVVAKGKSDICIFKLNPAGEIIWGKTFGNTGDDIAWGISMSSYNVLAIAGQFEDKLILGDAADSNYTLIAKGGTDMFFALLDPDGNTLGCRKGFNTGNDICYSITLADNGEIVLTGMAHEYSSNSGAAFIMGLRYFSLPAAD